MSAITASKRKFWQLHLMTILILSPLALGLIWLNVRGKDGRERVYFNKSDPANTVAIHSRGWPLDFFTTIQTPTQGDYVSDWSVLFANAGICLTLVLAFAALVESVIRRIRLSLLTLASVSVVTGAFVGANVLARDGKYGFPFAFGEFCTCGEFLWESNRFGVDVGAFVGVAVLTWILCERVVRRSS